MQIQKILEHVFCFQIPLPDNPLRWLNCYVIKKDDGRSLLIDTGFHRPECTDALLQGIAALGLSADSTDVLITHGHADHFGNAYELKQRGFTIMMGEIDYHLIYNTKWSEKSNAAIREGMTAEEARLFVDLNSTRNYLCPPFDPILLHEGSFLHYAGYSFECMLMPGHTPGHICLYDRAKGLIFSGDHVLFDISPNISARDNFPDMLGTYLNSLKHLRSFPIQTVLPAHRGFGCISIYERIDQLIEHHYKRLDEIMGILALEPGLSAYDICQKMKWKIHADNWDSFPASQKWFALSETIAHVEHLLAEKEIRRETQSNGVNLYFIK